MRGMRDETDTASYPVPSVRPVHQLYDLLRSRSAHHHWDGTRAIPPLFGVSRRGIPVVRDSRIRIGVSDFAAMGSIRVEEVDGDPVHRRGRRRIPTGDVGMRKSFGVVATDVLILYPQK